MSVKAARCLPHGVVRRTVQGRMDIDGSGLRQHTRPSERSPVERCPQTCQSGCRRSAGDSERAHEPERFR
ncbi:hypothetical protein TVNIR_2353 [Thioalkalivibrio nitratireducens DSM 14787]|uniref:Uncharacterized protein n=1 Tax=Thioalkalivibrio nitratireducens (strain DSM 14787 / UNIQEM 213 / ALEN2) TaxID=1255043 RepID=L0E048_THIND|nr:hypothetical protein TVNIR_2353 [Thioalkalivibrio nitratireducens DSM 14787]